MSHIDDACSFHDSLFQGEGTRRGSQVELLEFSFCRLSTFARCCTVVALVLVSANMIREPRSRWSLPSIVHSARSCKVQARLSGHLVRQMKPDHQHRSLVLLRLGHRLAFLPRCPSLPLSRRFRTAAHLSTVYKLARSLPALTPTHSWESALCTSSSNCPPRLSLCL